MKTLSDEILCLGDDYWINKKGIPVDKVKASIKELREKLVDGRTVPRVDKIINEVFGRKLT